MRLTKRPQGGKGIRRFLFCALLTVVAEGSDRVLAQSANVEALVRAGVERPAHEVTYDGSYRRIGYPQGDVPEDIGVCTDLIVRAYRAVGIDLGRGEDRRAAGQPLEGARPDELPGGGGHRHPDPVSILDQTTDQGRRLERGDATPHAQEYRARTHRPMISASSPIVRSRSWLTMT